MPRTRDDGGAELPSPTDAGDPPRPPNPALDAATDEDAGAVEPGDAGGVFDAGRTCDLTLCPDPSRFTPALIYGDAVACCTDDGVCGVLETNYYDYRECMPLQRGEPDATCPDVLVDGETLEGCCNPRAGGRCGHQDPELGCHEIFSAYWLWELHKCGDDGYDPPPTNPLVCRGDEEPCTYDWECCSNPNYGSLCHHSIDDEPSVCLPNW